MLVSARRDGLLEIFAETLLDALVSNFKIQVLLYVFLVNRLKDFYLLRGHAFANHIMPFWGQLVRRSAATDTYLCYPATMAT